MRFFISLLLFLGFLLPSYGKTVDNNTQILINKPKILLERGIKQYKIGSYNTALEYFLKLLARDKKRGEYYRKALFMLAKTYMKIGIKTGNKQYLWQALDFLQLYFNSVKQPSWDYYYTKAHIYENLGFYDKGLDIYRVAFLKAKNDRQQVRTVMGILRCAVFLKRPDIIDEYYILLSTSPLTEKDKDELRFLRGLILFSKGKYDEAFKYFFETYRRNEAYLIENPEYYYIVAENIYRQGNYKLAEQLFKRIISFTRDKAVIRKAILRLGDAELRKGERKLASATYYDLVTSYPDSKEAVIAKLKLIAMMDKDKVLKYHLQSTQVEDFKNPLKFVIKTLIHSRDTYLGAFALADFGSFVLKSKSRKLFKQLKWELSLIFPGQLKYEQKEFIFSQWKPLILRLDDEKMCSLYKANPEFFKEVFDKETLIHIAYALGRCNERDLKLSLIRYIAKKWQNDKDLLLLAEALMESKDFEESIEILQKVREKNCMYYKLLIKNKLFLKEPIKQVKPLLLKLSKKCPSNDVDVVAFKIIVNLEDGKLNRAVSLFESNSALVKAYYKKDPILKLAVYKLISQLLMHNRYNTCLSVIDMIKETGNNCFLSAAQLISFSRLDKIEPAKAILPKVKMCKDTLSEIARVIYGDQILMKNLGRE
ncbi:tetratricopeptide repeat protein [Desulfurobacterium atlanticum]|uniref:Tetratricopeptide repeat-containing protein n=1 Tax=Desulfurobacterium atlanticum TaxID=240169 RepID=A0A238Z0E6_9BACT|nr:tetratricopeptide repeat protein [Desulfurobacterium atlanticum]SNR76383.1 Tetratricopeptide repeat-containing protein [Desulfurobacterium atlanticum]